MTDRVSTDRVVELLAAHVRLDPARLGAALRGERGLSSLDLALIAETCGVDVLWLLGQEGR